jgi:hypothetical protein
MSKEQVGLVKAVLTHHVKLRRDGRGVKLALEADADPRDITDAESVPGGDQDAVPMHDALRALLDGVPHSRSVLTHLAVIEHHLRRKGSLFIFDLPLHVARQALRQLDGLAVPPVDEGMAALRGRLADAIELRERLERHEKLNKPLSSFLVDHKLEVREVSLTSFDRAALGFPPSQPPGT